MTIIDGLCTVQMKDVDEYTTRYLVDEYGNKVVTLFTSTENAQRFINEEGWGDDWEPSGLPVSLAVELIVESDKSGASFYTLNPRLDNRLTVCSVTEMLAELICQAYEEGQGDAKAS